MALSIYHAQPLLYHIRLRVIYRVLFICCTLDTVRATIIIPHKVARDVSSKLPYSHSRYITYFSYAALSIHYAQPLLHHIELRVTYRETCHVTTLDTLRATIIVPYMVARKVSRNLSCNCTRYITRNHYCTIYGCT